MNKWWAYIHSVDGAIHLKRWFPGPPGQLCDLEYAKQEMLDGNDFILQVTPWPFEANTREEALKKAEIIFYGNKNG
jgi:hypothetical protein